MTEKAPDPADKHAGADQFQPTNHRAGYQTDKLAWLMQWLTDHPDADLRSGEGKVLRMEIERLRDAIAIMYREVLSGCIIADIDIAEQACAFAAQEGRDEPNDSDAIRAILFVTNQLGGHA